MLLRRPKWIASCSLSRAVGLLSREDSYFPAQKAELMQVMASGKPATNGKSEKSIRNEIAVVKAFKKAGFGDVKPHVDVKTFNKRMLDDGLRPAEGSMSIRVAHLR